ncbi:G-protein coupled receptor 151 [Synchiropus picturatus]
MESLRGNSTAVANVSVEKWSVTDGGAHQQLEPGELRRLVPGVLGVICVLGVACNLMAAAIVCSSAHKGKLSLINSLIFNLMLADGLLLLFSLPLRAASYCRSSWTLGWMVCKTSDWFLQSCMAAKSFTVAVLAQACYRYVSNPTKQVSIHLGSILVLLFFVWVSACAAATPQWLFAALHEGVPGPLCVLAVPPEAQHFMLVYIKAYPLGVYCAPLSWALLYFWKAYGQCQRRSSRTQNLRTQIRSRKLTLMLFSLTVAMALLWLPQWVVWVWERHLAETETEGGKPGPTPPLLFTLLAQLLTFSLSVVNPLIVLSLSEEFREGYRGLWRRLTLRKQLPSKPHSGPHNPTSLKSPCPRPETSGQLLRDSAPFAADSSALPQPEQPREADGTVLPDVEQFWHERETGANADENDPVPWEHQGTGEKTQS